MKVRAATAADLESIVRWKVALWPEGSAEEHRAETSAALAKGAPALFVADDAGFVEVQLRSHADGCDSSPVGFIEGWYVDPGSRRNGVGSALIAAAEEWARERGCSEMASDALIANALSQIAHQSLGYEVVDRCVHYRKAL
jgi:aminoglycoside 6'-N-acetyltransferase I